jgi:hypothetical protein
LPESATAKLKFSMMNKIVFMLIVSAFSAGIVFAQPATEKSLLREVRQGFENALLSFRKHPWF